MSEQTGARLALLWLAAGAACSGGASAEPARRTHPPPPGPRQVAESAPPASGEAFPVPAPPFSEGVFPCSQCHAELETDRTPRPLEEHQAIQLAHGTRDRWCFDCHDPQDRDKLRLASGAPVPFAESYRLCGQCHGPKLRDWRVGVHGKRSGSWDGAKRYLLCAHCHDPHTPRFKPIKPMPPPARPGAIR